MNTPPQPPAPDASEFDRALARLGLGAGQTVQEFGWDDDVDEDVRTAVEDVVGSALEDEAFTGGAGAVLLWWRAPDGDLTDALVDLVGVLDDGGPVVLLTPRRTGAVDASEVDEASATAGLHASGSVPLGPHWRATRLLARRPHRR